LNQNLKVMTRLRFAVHGQRHADRGVQHEPRGEHQRVVLGERVGLEGDTGVTIFQFSVVNFS